MGERIEPLLPKVERRLRYPGRKRLPDRQALQGIVFVLDTGIAWRHLPLELGFGGGSTCYRRMVEWQHAGVWERLHAVLLAELRAAAEIEWSRAIADASHVQAKTGSATFPSPVDRARSGSKHHLLVDATGIPLAWAVTGGNRDDVTQLILLVERVPPARGKPGRPRRRPERVTADRGYDHDTYRRKLRRPGIDSEIARRETGHGSGTGTRPLGGRAHLSLAPPLRAAARPLQPPPRDPRRLPRDRLLPRLLQKTPELIVIRVLRQRYMISIVADGGNSI